MNWYLYQEVLCPFCQKKYMTRIYEEFDTELHHQGVIQKGWADICPKCSVWVFVVEDQLEGIDLSKYPKEEVHRKFFLR